MRTPEGIEVRLGQVWRDNDRRYDIGDMTVVELDLDKQRVRVRRPTNKTWIALKRLRNNSTGYQLIKDVGTPQCCDRTTPHEHPSDDPGVALWSAEEKAAA
jgi:hypothetical protein